MVICKIAITAIISAGVVALYAGYDSWINRRKYKAREDRRRARGGLD